MVPGKTYDISQNYITMNGHRIGGYGDDGGIEYEHGSDLVEVAVGADGEVTFSRSNNWLMYANITVRENSNSCRMLAQMQQMQEASPTIVPIAFYHRDALNGDEVRDGAVFVQVPGPSKGRTAGERVFRIALPNGRRGMRLASTSLL